jgi:DNA mismatch repair protein MutS
MGLVTMFIDAATLRDLEIVPAPTARDTTLWSLLNRTRTRVGSEALRHQLLNPPQSADAILALQRAHQRLAADAEAYLQTLDRAAADTVERYLNVTWQLPCEMPPLMRLRSWYTRYMQEAERGRALLKALFESAADLRIRLGRTDSVILQRLGDDIAKALDMATMQALRRAVAHASTIDVDQLARGRARSDIICLLQYVGRVEALRSMGVATSEHGWTYPKPSTRLRASGLFHPFLGRNAVRNDLHLDEHIRVCFITGPNMAGKSTFLKATAIALLLAHTGCGVPATCMEFVPVGCVFSSVDLVDNLSAGESFYLAEVRRIGALAAALADHDSALAVIDEPFRGTNVHDANEATLAVITRLVAHPAALVLVASHLVQVAPAILDDRRIAFFCFAADVAGEQPRFDYCLRPGVSEQRLGMTLLRQEGVLDSLERAAKRLTRRDNALDADPAS